MSKLISGLDVLVLIMGDSAFKFSNKLMKLDSFKVEGHLKEKIFNYNFPKCRRVVENSFGHIRSWFRSIGKDIGNHRKNLFSVIKTCCVP